MSGDDLRSDGALEYHADAVLMVDPHPKNETADFLVLKHRNGPTGAFPGVHWPNLPRTAAYRGV
jgi:replicative DNA helicase